MGADGSFEFAGIPPGKYTMAVDPTTGNPRLYLVSENLEVGTEPIANASVLTTRQFIKMTATVSAESETLSPNMFPAIVFVGPMAKVRVLAELDRSGFYKASVPVGATYDVAVENLPAGFEVKSITTTPSQAKATIILRRKAPKP